MSGLSCTCVPVHLTLNAETAADLMAPNPVSIHEDAPIGEAVALLVDKGYSAAPVIDDAGRPVGVVSRADIVAHDREKLECVAPVPAFYAEHVPEGYAREEMGKGFQVVDVDRTRVKDVMTPVVFSVAPHLPADKVVSEMLALHVHRLFVVDTAGVLVGVISSMDVLQKLV